MKEAERKRLEFLANWNYTLMPSHLHLQHMEWDSSLREGLVFFCECMQQETNHFVALAVYEGSIICLKRVEAPQ